MNAKLSLEQVLTSIRNGIAQIPSQHTEIAQQFEALCDDLHGFCERQQFIDKQHTEKGELLD